MHAYVYFEIITIVILKVLGHFPSATSPTLTSPVTNFPNSNFPNR